MPQKNNLFIYVLMSALVFSACSASKEDQVKSMLGLPQNAGPALDPLVVAEKDPTFANLTAAGLSLSQNKQAEKALAYFKRALEKDPNSGLAQNNVCAEYNGLQQWDAALPYCEKAVALLPDFQLAKNNLNFAKAKKKSQLELIETLKAKSQSAKGDAKRAAMIDLGFEFYKMTKYADAIQVWEQVQIGKDDMTVRLLNNLGSAHIQLKQFAKAGTVLNDALKIDPNNQLVKNNLAWLQSAEATAKK